MDIEAIWYRTAARPRAALLGLTLFAWSPQAFGQTAAAEDVASARVLGTEGVKLAESGDCREAIVKLEAAEKLYHAPTTLERLGECEVKVGQLVAGTEALNRVTRETLAPGAPPAFVAAQQRAAQVYGANYPRIGKLRLHVDGVSSDKVTVTVDGDAVPAALFDADRPTDPGTHEIKASAVGYQTSVVTVQLPDGGSSAVSLTLEPDPNAAAAGGSVAAPGELAVAPSPSAPSPGEKAAGPTSPNRVPAIVAFAAGGVGLAVGAAFGIMALGTKSNLDQQCPGKVCPTAASQSDIDALSTRATISSIGFIAGGIGVAAGAVLLITARGGAEPSRPAASSSFHAYPWLGVGEAGVGGTFE